MVKPIDKTILTKLFAIHTIFTRNWIRIRKKLNRTTVITSFISHFNILFFLLFICFPPQVLLFCFNEKGWHRSIPKHHKEIPILLLSKHLGLDSLKSCFSTYFQKSTASKVLSVKSIDFASWSIIVILFEKPKPSDVFQPYSFNSFLSRL